jgi:hypothetical protein
MARILWIIGLSITLLMSSGSVVICLVALVTHRHLNLTGWMMLVAGAIAAKAAYAWLRSAILYGDPTKTSPTIQTINPSAAGSDTPNSISR